MNDDASAPAEDHLPLSGFCVLPRPAPASLGATMPGHGPLVHHQWGDSGTQS